MSITILDKIKAYKLEHIAACKARVPLSEVEARAHDLNAPESVPYFKNNDEESLFLRLKGNARAYAGKD